MILAYLASTWRTLAIAAAACLLCLTLGYCEGDRSRAAKDGLALKRAEVAALRINAAATAIADRQRTTDTTRIDTQDKDRLDAIQSAPPSRTGAATRALSCERLRQAGRHSDADRAGC